MTIMRGKSDRPMSMPSAANGRGAAADDDLLDSDMIATAAARAAREGSF
jgi:hypothetical protein